MKSGVWKTSIYIDLYNLLPQNSVYEWMKIWEVHIVGKEPESFVTVAVDENKVQFDFQGGYFQGCRQYSGFMRAEDSIQFRIEVARSNSKSLVFNTNTTKEWLSERQATDWEMSQVSLLVPHAMERLDLYCHTLFSKK